MRKFIFVPLFLLFFLAVIPGTSFAATSCAVTTGTNIQVGTYPNFQMSGTRSCSTGVGANSQDGDMPLSYSSFSCSPGHDCVHDGQDWDFFWNYSGYAQTPGNYQAFCYATGPNCPGNGVSYVNYSIYVNPPNLSYVAQCNASSPYNAQNYLSWTVASSPSSYYVYRNGSYLASTGVPYYTDSAITAGTSYSYYVVANYSTGYTTPVSNTVSFSSKTCDTTPPTGNITTTIPLCVTSGTWPAAINISATDPGTGASGVKTAKLNLIDTANLAIAATATITNSTPGTPVTWTPSFSTIPFSAMNTTDYYKLYLYLTDAAGNPITATTADTSTSFQAQAVCGTPYIQTQNGDVHTQGNIQTH